MLKREAEIIEELKEKVRDFPRLPGVYLMKNEAEKIIYVGKAKDIRSRVRSYLTDSKEHSPKTRLLVRNIRTIDTILTKTEVEAFLLEASLIKKHRPRYNIRLKDDKSYPYIRISMADPFPRLYLARKVKKDGSMYFGPYTNGTAVWGTIRFLNRTFQIRDCKDAFMATRKRPCMTHQIGRCKAPCVDLVSKDECGDDIKQAVTFLRGRDKQIVRDLTKKMKQASEDERYEAAAKVRDSIEAIKQILERQAVVNDTSELDQDVVGYHGDERGTLVEMIHIRSGRVIGNKGHFLPLLDSHSQDEDVREWLTSYLNQYYDEALIPDELLLPVDLGRDLTELMTAVFVERSGRKVKIRFPTDTAGSSLLELAATNAKEHFGGHVDKSEMKKKALEEIQERLKLPTIPVRIECFDISTFQGAETVASQVVFEDGVPNKDQYRRYKIKTVKGTNDFESMREVLTRRFKHTELDLPDLVVIDGGKGQLGIATEVFKEIGQPGIPVVGLAKARTDSDFSSSEVRGSEERFFLPGRQNPVIFKSSSEAFRILVSIRDEAHRFAITYHRKLRESTSLESELDQINGLGPARKKTLLTAFNSIDEIRSADVEKIAALKGFNRASAEVLLEELARADLGSDSGHEEPGPEIT
jgi:excinuclease ABC subunit C